jgi:hypothetical protein
MPRTAANGRLVPKTLLGSVAPHVVHPSTPPDKLLRLDTNPRWERFATRISLRNGEGYHNVAVFGHRWDDIVCCWPILLQKHFFGDGRGQIKEIVSIRQRPAAVEDRAVPGHWEGDLLSGSTNSYNATPVERHTRYVMLAKVANKDTQTVVSALIKQAKRLPSELYKSLTWDRGKELTDHRRFRLTTNIDVYFCVRKARGNVDQMETPTACCDNTSPGAPTYQCTHKPI